MSNRSTETTKPDTRSKNESRPLNVADKLFLYIWPFKDSLGVYLAGIPLRIGEIYNTFYSFYLLLCGKNLSGRLKGYSGLLIALLLLNLLYSLTTGIARLDEVDISFFLKYLIRNALCLFLVFAIVVSNREYDDQSIRKMLLFALFLQLLFGIVGYLTGSYLYISEVLKLPDIGIGDIIVNRFCGTASEAAYVTPILITIYYYFDMTDEKYSQFVRVAVIALVFLTFSSFAYMVLAAVILLCEIQKKRYLQLKIAVIIFAAFLMFFFMSVSGESNIIVQNIQKMIGFASGGSFGETDHSASDRLQQLNSVITMISSGDMSQWLFGHGTGAYSFNQLITANAERISNAQEAYNVYLSTVADRGLIGLVLEALIIYSIFKIRTRNIVSDTLAVGIAVQFVHMFLIGNFWPALLWAQIGMLIGHEFWLSQTGSQKELKV